MGRLPTQQTVEIHENLERKRLKAASIKKSCKEKGEANRNHNKN